MKKINHSNVIHLMEKWAPKSLAYDWDPIGLQVGNMSDVTTNILVTLDVLERVVDEAIEKNANLIVAHHPLIFKPLSNINLQTAKGKTIEKLIKHDITVYAAHTNLDIAEGGVNDLLAEKLELEVTDFLVPFSRDKLYKVIVYVPLSHLDEVREAFHRGGAGHIGNYSHCTFQALGKGTFKPLEGSNPYSGEKNTLTFVEEARLESIVPENNLKSVIKEMKKAHPYEEVAYDIYLLENEGKSYGLGRIGQLKKEMSLNDLAFFVKKRYQLEQVRVTGDVNKRIKKVAILGGSGEKYIFDAIRKGVDVLITGDMTFHFAQDAMEMGLNIIDAGHYIEEIMIEATKNYLEKNITNKNIKVLASEENTNPFKYL